jgi:chemotaxis protein methyltransferase CheR
MSARERLAQRIEDWFGLDLARGGRLDALERVVTQRALREGYASPDAYVAALTGADDPEVLRLLDTVTVGHTWFFRDRGQTEAILAELRSVRRERLPAEVWVAGCSTGEDAYTVALLARAAGVAVEVLGTDINPFVLERARAARYAEWSTRQVPDAYAKHFVRVEGGGDQLHPEVVRDVRFERHNLVDASPRPRRAGGWDIIVCRNVLIYFRRGAAQQAIDGLSEALCSGGWLFLGAAEVLQRAPPGCRLAWIGSRLAIQKLGPGVASSVEPPGYAGGTPPGPRGRLERTLERTPERAPADPERQTMPPAEPEGDLIQRALALAEAGQNGEAIMLCAKALQADPLRAEAHLVSGIAYHLGNDPEAAARELRSALLLAPELWPALFYLGQALDKLGRQDEAKEAYREADERSRAAPSGRLGVLEAYRTEMAALARERARRGGAC